MLTDYFTLILKQIPQWFAEYCLSIHFQHGVVVCTHIHPQQAVDLALRVAEEMDVNIGHQVGYSIPLETCCTNETVLRCGEHGSSVSHLGPRLLLPNKNRAWPGNTELNRPAFLSSREKQTKDLKGLFF